MIEITSLVADFNILSSNFLLFLLLFNAIMNQIWSFRIFVGNMLHCTLICSLYRSSTNIVKKVMNILDDEEI